MIQPLSASARIAFIIGHPVAHTAMPARLNAMFSGRDRAMIPLNVPPDGLRNTVSALRQAENVDGWVVTAPHKQAMAKLVDRLAPEAAATGMVNLAWMSESGVWGDNTDGAGFCAALRNNGICPAGQRVLIFGAGGAGAAIAHALSRNGDTLIDVCDPDVARARSLGKVASAVLPPDSVAPYDLVVNATPIGLDGTSLVHDLTGLRPDATAADVLALPTLSPFLAKAQQLGAQLQTGQEMAHAQIPFVAERFGWKLE